VLDYRNGFLHDAKDLNDIKFGLGDNRCTIAFDNDQKVCDAYIMLAVPKTKTLEKACTCRAFVHFAPEKKVKRFSEIFSSSMLAV